MHIRCTWCEKGRRKYEIKYIIYIYLINGSTQQPNRSGQRIDGSVHATINTDINATDQRITLQRINGSTQSDQQINATDQRINAMDQRINATDQQINAMHQRINATTDQRINRSTQRINGSTQQRIKQSTDQRNGSTDQRNGSTD